LTTEPIDDCEHAKWASIEQLITNEIHTPTLMCSLRLKYHTGDAGTSCDGFQREMQQHHRGRPWHRVETDDHSMD
jgi:hypothetical protein